MEKKALQTVNKALTQGLIKTGLSPEPKRIPKVPFKLPMFWRSFRFANKLLCAGSLVYYTYHQGAWGTPEESLEFVDKFSEHVKIFKDHLTPYHIAALFRDID